MRFFKQLQSITIYNNFDEPAIVLFLAVLEQKKIHSLVNRALVMGCYIDDVFMSRQDRKKVQRTLTNT